ncbi:MAG: hypothetical protein CMP10_02885 [Zetaproteobacteria bacterium]|nr:hypothetical protein [Pseudobdellovibrionaceae bacterium]
MALWNVGKRKGALAILSCFCIGAASYAADQVTEAVNEQAKTVTQNRKSQKKVDTLVDQTSDMLTNFRMTVQATESQKIYNDQLAKLITSQKEESVSIAEQINNIEVTNKEVVPLMLKMIAAMKQFVELDVPFLLEERRNRVASLEKMMNRADVSTSEKFRRVLEAYQIENEYGRSIEAWSGDVVLESGSRTVDFLRIGRMILIWQTLDGKIAQIWDQKNKKWNELPDSYRSTIKQGLKIARRQAAPDLLKLPIPAAEAK